MYDSYQNIMIYLYFTIIIKKNDKNSFISSISDNLIDTTYILNKYKLDYFNRIDNKLNEINLKKYYNNNDYNVFYYKFKNNHYVELGSYIYILYIIRNFKIIPIQLLFDLKNLDFNYKYNYNSFYIVKVKINKYYKNIFEYEYFKLYQL